MPNEYDQWLMGLDPRLQGVLETIELEQLVAAIEPEGGGEQGAIVGFSDTARDIEVQINVASDGSWSYLWNWTYCGAESDRRAREELMISNDQGRMVDGAIEPEHLITPDQTYLGSGRGTRKLGAGEYHWKFTIPSGRGYVGIASGSFSSSMADPNPPSPLPPSPKPPALVPPRPPGDIDPEAERVKAFVQEVTAQFEVLADGNWTCNWGWTYAGDVALTDVREDIVVATNRSFEELRGTPHEAAPRSSMGGVVKGRELVSEFGDSEGTLSIYYRDVLIGFAPEQRLPPRSKPPEPVPPRPPGDLDPTPEQVAALVRDVTAQFEVLPDGRWTCNWSWSYIGNLPLTDVREGIFVLAENRLIEEHRETPHAVRPKSSTKGGASGNEQIDEHGEVLANLFVYYKDSIVGTSAIQTLPSRQRPTPTPPPPTPPTPPRPARATLTPEERAEAEAWNLGHIPNVVKFDRATKGRFAKRNGQLDADGVARWQAEHNLEVSGKADDQTVVAAAGGARGKTPASPTPTPNQAPSPVQPPSGDLRGKIENWLAQAQSRVVQAEADLQANFQASMRGLATRIGAMLQSGEIDESQARVLVQNGQAELNDQAMQARTKIDSYRQLIGQIESLLGQPKSPQRDAAIQELLASSNDLIPGQTNFGSPI